MKFSTKVYFLVFEYTIFGEGKDTDNEEVLREVDQAGREVHPCWRKPTSPLTLNPSTPLLLSLLGLQPLEAHIPCGGVRGAGTCPLTANLVVANELLTTKTIYSVGARTHFKAIRGDYAIYNVVDNYTVLM